MKGRFCIYFILLLLIIPGKVEGQRWKLARYEAGIGIGTTHPFMDIGSEKDAFKSLQFTDTRVSVSPHIGFKIREELTVKLDLNYLMIGGADSETRERSLRYTSHCFEPILRVDYTIFNSERGIGKSALFRKRGMINDFGTSMVYVFAGGGGILSKAKVKDANGDEVIGNSSYHNKLQWGFVIPAGIGYKRTFNAYFDFAFEVGGRFTFTDLIDGYQHPTASDYNDRYIITNVKAIYKIRNDRKGRPILRRGYIW